MKSDIDYLNEVYNVSKKSPDPSTQCGAIIVKNDSVVSSGVNKFPDKIDNDITIYQNREEKYSRILHCEINAIFSAFKNNINIENSTLYTYPFLTCNRCAVHVIEAGITRVVSPKCPPELEERWEDSFKKARQYYREAGIEVCEIDYVPET